LNSGLLGRLSTIWATPAQPWTLMLLPHPSQCWAYRYVLPHLASSLVYWILN
jgi:hypothetical protein